MSIIKNDYIFRLFAAISLFFRDIFFHFRTDEKIEISPVILWPQFFVYGR